MCVKRGVARIPRFSSENQIVKELEVTLEAAVHQNAILA